MGRHNGSQKKRTNPHSEINPKLAEVVQLHPLAQFQKQQSLITFGQLKVGDKFILPRKENYPKEDCPVHIKTELALKDIDSPFSGVFNCRVGPWKEWLPDVIEVVQVF